MQSHTGRSLSRFRIVFLALLIAGISATGAAAIGEGDPAPEFLLTDLDGLDHSLSGYSPHPVLLMFFGADAQASIALAPLIQSDLYDVFVPRGLRILGIECSGSAYEQVETFRNRTGVRFPLLLDGVAAEAEYGVQPPCFVLVGGNGTVRYVSTSPGIDAYEPDRLANAVEETLQESNDTKAATWGLIKSLYSD